MRAVVIESPGPAEALRVVAAPDPQPGSGELSIDVEYAGVGFVDTLFRAGAFGLPMPLVPGIEVAGRVRAVGPEVVGFRTGQPVAALLNDFGRGPRAGGYAEIAVARQHGGRAARRRRAVDDDRGGTTSRLAALHPARQVIGVVGSEAKRAAASTECTDVVLATELAASLERLTNGDGVDVVIDPVGGGLRTEAYRRLPRSGGWSSWATPAATTRRCPATTRGTAAGN